MQHIHPIWCGKQWILEQGIWAFWQDKNPWFSSWNHQHNRKLSWLNFLPEPSALEHVACVFSRVAEKLEMITQAGLPLISLGWKSTSRTKLVAPDSDKEFWMEVLENFLMIGRYVPLWVCKLWFWFFGHRTNMKMPHSLLRASRVSLSELRGCFNDHRTPMWEIVMAGQPYASRHKWAPRAAWNCCSSLVLILKLEPQRMPQQLCITQSSMVIPK